MCSSDLSIPSHLLTVDSNPFASGSFGEVYHATLDGSPVCVKRLRVAAPDALEFSTKVRYRYRHARYAYSHTNPKMFCKEAIMWKGLNHPNILPLLGATISPPQLISALMPAGDLSKYIPKNPDANRIGLVGVNLVAPSMTAVLIPATSYLRLQRASAICIPAT